MIRRIHCFGLTITISRPRPRIRLPELDDDELTAAFKVDDGNRLWIAINQLIETLAHNSRIRAWECIDQPGRSAGYVGADEALQQLQDDIEIRRMLALEASRRILHHRTVPARPLTSEDEEE